MGRMSGNKYRDVDGASQPMNPQAMPMAIAQPINDIQIAALIAAQFKELPAKEAVAKATELVVEAVAQNPMFQQRISKRIAEVQAEMHAAEEKSRRDAEDERTRRMLDSTIELPAGVGP